VAWPVYYASGKLRAGAGVRRSLLGTIRRRDGRRQVTYNGWPLYYYIGDRRPGQVTCQNVSEFGGLWLVVRPAGTLVR
jgi:predicted lipoprotein with Yx(FWY)xxD motif